MVNSVVLKAPSDVPLSVRRSSHLPTSTKGKCGGSLDTQHPLIPVLSGPNQTNIIECLKPLAGRCAVCASALGALFSRSYPANSLQNTMAFIRYAASSGRWLSRRDYTAPFAPCDTTFQEAKEHVRRRGADGEARDGMGCVRPDGKQRTISQSRSSQPASSTQGAPSIWIQLYHLIMSLYRSPSAALLKSPSQAAFGAPFGSMSVADLGSLTRLEVTFLLWYFLNWELVYSCTSETLSISFERIHCSHFRNRTSRPIVRRIISRGETLSPLSALRNGYRSKIFSATGSLVVGSNRASQLLFDFVSTRFHVTFKSLAVRFEGWRSEVFLNVCSISISLSKTDNHFESERLRKRSLIQIIVIKCKVSWNKGVRILHPRAICHPPKCLSESLYPAGFFSFSDVSCWSAPTRRRVV